MTATTIRTLLTSFRIRFANEAQLQGAIAAILTEAGVEFSREAPLSPRDRPDFLLPGGAVLEVKTQGSLNDVTRQLFRYASLDAVTEIILVTSQMQHRCLPAKLNDKRVDVVYLAGSVL